MSIPDVGLSYHLTVFQNQWSQLTHLSINHKVLSTQKVQRNQRIHLEQVLMLCSAHPMVLILQSQSLQSQTKVVFFGVQSQTKTKVVSYD